MNSSNPQYRIVLGRPARRTWQRAAWITGWVLSLLLVAGGMWMLGGPSSQLEAHRQLQAARSGKAKLQNELDQLQRRMVVLQQSDRISRAANLDLQDTLTQREIQIADLRSDVEFYARLVGPTAQRTDLTVFSSKFTERDAASFDYRIVLTQTLNRGAISSGQMQFSLEGTRAGRREVLDWAQLHGSRGVTPQAFSFRYFQELSGSVALPPGFTPQRVRVSLQAPERAPVQREFDWSTASG
ncbi:hypothetical protein SAMN05428989_1753 [Pseudoxanthomonas sp. GM95]|uniref:DUF6776 family protein n=1 Tax=Pseudoxanthomonas sp. GM95 TaxID=1881043 RepID=UPI0008AD732B|nr:DUF6776 family protein [Pseudoxanthomonas sp. GM95]SEL48618.1 hypothetical protein SAMN05428989_1753 [Pseudoxanthomonas sp. GM95]